MLNHKQINHLIISQFGQPTYSNCRCSIVLLGDTLEIITHTSDAEIPDKICSFWTNGKGLVDFGMPIDRHKIMSSSLESEVPEWEEAFKNNPYSKERLTVLQKIWKLFSRWIAKIIGKGQLGEYKEWDES